MTEDAHHDAPKEKKDYIAKNKKLYADKSFLKDEWLHCSGNSPVNMVYLFFCGCFNRGGNWSLAQGTDACNPLLWVLGCWCGFCTCALVRSDVQKAVGVDDDGCVWNCFMNLCVCCQPCSLNQDNRAIVRWKKATNEKFKEKYKASKYAWTTALYAVTM